MAFVHTYIKDLRCHFSSYERIAFAACVGRQTIFNYLKHPDLPFSKAWFRIISAIFMRRGQLV